MACKYCDIDKNARGEYINNSKRNGGLILGDDLLFFSRDKYGSIDLIIENQERNITSLIVNYCPVCGKKVGE